MDQPVKSINNSLTAGLAAIGIFLGAVGLAAPAQAQSKPNIVVIWGDDIGITNLSVYTAGLTGYRTSCPASAPSARAGNTA